jgi:hypothetical protein
MKQRGFFEIFVVLAVVLVFAAGGYYFWTQKLLFQPKYELESDIVATSLASPAEISWRTFNKEGKFKVSYPSNWQAAELSGNLVGLGSSTGGIGNGQGVRITCPADYLGHALPTPPNFNYITEYTGKPEYYRYLTINNMKAIQWILDETLITAILRENDPIVCEFETGIIKETKDVNNYEKTIEEQTTYNKILQSFKFVQ